jgi:transposase-like protein
MVPKNGVSRRTVSGSMSERRTWQCRPCRRQFSATTGTMMHGTRLPLRIWVLVIFEMSASKNGISAAEISRKYGVCNRTAWFLMHRIREAMAGPYKTLFHGVVMADEVYIGGDPSNRHASQRRDDEKDGRGTDKTPVVTIIDQDTGEVRSHIVGSLDQWNLGKLIIGNVEPAGSVLVTDGFKGYNLAGSFFGKHAVVDHSAGQYVVSGYSTNAVESFFSQLVRSLDGTHHHVSVKHLHRYVAEHDFRRSTCKVTDAERMTTLVEQSDGQRLTYAQVRG